jgi:hypothetical protein
VSRVEIDYGSPCIYCGAKQPEAGSTVCTAMMMCWKSPHGGHAYEFRIEPAAVSEERK